jgi:hypothetical protein
MPGRHRKPGDDCEASIFRADPLGLRDTQKERGVI